MGNPAVRRASNTTVDNLVNPPTCELYLDTGNGHGSTATKIRRFSNVGVNSLAPYMTYVDDATNGMSITCNIAGRYEFFFADFASAASGQLGLSVNANALLTTNITSLTYAQGKRAMVNSPSANVSGCFTISLDLVPGDVVRAHTNGGNNAADINCIFKVLRLGN